MQGIAVDVELMRVLQSIVDQASPKLEAEFNTLVHHQVKISSSKRIVYFKQWYPWLESMDAENVERLLNDPRPVPREVKRAIEIIAEFGSSSVKKLTVGLAQNHHGRLYQLLAYGITQTKRWAGRGIQMHNFPRPEQKPLDPLPDFNVTNLADTIRQMAPTLKDPLAFVKNCLRRIWLPDAGHEFYCGDLAKIEPTVLFWLVGLGDIPKNWYEQMAAAIYQVAVETIGKDSEERQVGKAAALSVDIVTGKQIGRAHV